MRQAVPALAGCFLGADAGPSVDGFVNEGVTTQNVIAETPGGRDDRTVVVGGHLDSVDAGPGINDDGSGVSMMMELAQQMLREPTVEKGDSGHLRDARLRHARLGQLRPLDLRRRRERTWLRRTQGIRCATPGYLARFRAVGGRSGRLVPRA
jgi:hypothetical protein